MAFIDGRELQSPFEIRSDVCIVGAGAAGLTLAAELLSRSRDVCVLEAGGFGPDADTQGLYDIESVGHPVREHYMSRARYFGGTCNLWAGRSMKLPRSDVEGRPWLDLAAWPIEYAELDRYYTRAARVLKLPARQACERATAMPRMSGDESRLFETGELAPNIALWGKRPRRFGTAFRAALRRNPRCKLVLYANATEIVLGASGCAVERIEATTLDGRKLLVRANWFILATGGLENARLLLVSRGRQVKGIGNANDRVGRCYMDHPRAVYGSVRLERPAQLAAVLGSPLADGKMQVGIALSKETQRRESLVHSYVSLEPELSALAVQQYQSSVSAMKVLLRKGHAGSRFDRSAMRLGEVQDMIYLLTPKELVPHALFRAYVATKRRIAGNVMRGRLTIINYGEQLPNLDSRVYLSADRDRLGLNKLVTDWKIGPDVGRSIVRLHELLDERLRRTGIGRVETDAADMNDRVWTDASHHMGTTRMSRDAEHGVVDSDCRVHGVANLFLAGGSVFPSSGHANPTWTIVALALRLADHVDQLPSRSPEW